MTTDATLPPGGAVRSGDPPWEAWHPTELARGLADVTVPCCVAGGRAVRRVHPGHPWVDRVDGHDRA